MRDQRSIAEAGTSESIYLELLSFILFWSKTVLTHGTTIFLEIASKVEIILNAYHACSYNAAFDFPFIQYAYIRYGLPVPNVNATCAMRLFSAYMDSDTNFSLEAACNMMHIDQNSYGKPHRALSDTLVTIELLKTLLKDTGDTNGNISIQTNRPLRDMR